MFLFWNISPNLIDTTNFIKFWYNELMKNLIIYEDSHFQIEKEKSEIPWVKIFSKEPYKELGDMPKTLRLELWEIYYIVEEEMKKYYKPHKINMASFANMLPRVHIHVMARYKEDSYFPNPMWGEKLRESNLELPKEELFYKNLFHALSNKSWKNTFKLFAWCKWN